MELFIWGLAVGGVVGMGGKRLAKPISKGYTVVAEKTREVAANVRESFRDVIEEARYEREQARAGRSEAEAEPVAAARPARRPEGTRRRRATARRAT